VARFPAVDLAPFRPKASAIVRAGGRHRRYEPRPTRAVRSVALTVCIVAGILLATAGGWVLAGGDPVGVAASVRLGAAGGARSAGAAIVAGTPTPGDVELRVVSEPPDARLLVDGREVGRTPLTAWARPGPHTVALERDDTLDEVRLLDLGGDGATLGVALWRKQPDAVRLRAAYPGATIGDARFLGDGRIALSLALPAAAPALGTPAVLHEAWLLDPDTGRLEPFGSTPTIRAEAVAVSPDGARLAYLQQAPPAGAGASALSPSGRPDEVWVASGDGEVPLRRVLQLPPPDRGSGYGMPPVERLADLTWAPDGRHLLVATRFGDGSSLTRSRLLLVDAEVPATGVSPPPVELVTMPAEVVPGSYGWSADGRWVAFLARAAAAPAGRGLVTLVAVDVATGGVSPEFRYVADEARGDTTATAAPPVAPVAWEPVATGSAPAARLLYTAPVARASSGSGGLFGLLGLGVPSSDTTTGLFLTAPALRALTADDQRRVGSATGLLGPVWRAAGTGPDGDPVLAFARADDNGGPLVLRAVDLDRGRVRDSGVRLPTDVAPGSVLGARWDAAHGRALLFARPSAGRGVAAPASGASPLDVWLVRFTTR
jgi:PEGA domain